MNDNLQNPQFTKQDLKVSSPVRWCAGCGNYSILSAMQNALPELNIQLENLVFVSGIGCSSRFPYYINTYGFHGIHGRGAAIASGIKLANPDLSVWLTTGDGDSLAIGISHLTHLIRRNIDINVLLFNNKIYALTKGQSSPTTPSGYKTKTSPEGVIERPILLGELAMGLEGTFFARVIDTDPKMMKQVFIEAAQHQGTSLVEILQNCVIFADGIHDYITNKKNINNNSIFLEHGKKMFFGENKGLRLNGARLEVVTIGENGITENDILTHDKTNVDDSIHFQLSQMNYPDFPLALGVIRAIEKDTFDSHMISQMNEAIHERTVNNIDELLKSGNIFNIS